MINLPKQIKINITASDCSKGQFGECTTCGLATSARRTFNRLKVPINNLTVGFTSVNLWSEDKFYRYELNKMFDIPDFNHIKETGIKQQRVMTLTTPL